MESIMLFKPGIAVSELSGTMGGTVASHNRGGQYFRQYRIPTNPSTALQQAVRAGMAAAVAAWSLLTQAQRDAWAAYAANTPWRNKVGETIYLTGMQMYIRTAVVLQQIKLSIGGTPNIPTLCTASGGLPSQAVILSGSVDVSAGLSLNYDAAEDWANEDGGILVVYMTEPRPYTQEFNGKSARFVGIVEGDSVTPPTSPLSVAAASLPYPLVAGQKTTILTRVIRADGTLSEPLRNHIVIT